MKPDSAKAFHAYGFGRAYFVKIAILQRVIYRPRTIKTYVEAGKARITKAF